MRYAYDALGRVVSITDRNGNTQSFTYDAKGQITKVTDKNGNETKYTYDGNGNILKTTDALGTDVLFEYNANGQLVKMTQNRVDPVHEQSEQLVTLYEYDGRNLVTKVVRADSEELYTYDGNGNMVSKTDGDGYVTEYSYNSLDLVSHINYNGTKEVTYQYNNLGELVKMDDWLGTTAFEVDLLGRLTQMTDHKGNVVSYEYDAVGNQISVTYPDETTVTKTYDEIYKLTKVHDAENKDYLYQYDDAGRVTKLTYPNGWVEDYTYDAEGNLLKTVDTDPFHNNKVSIKFEYKYDAEGNLISEYKRDTTAGNKALTTTYAYDALNRLVSAHEEGVGLNTTRTYDYDTLGNLIRQEEDGCIEYKYNGYALDETTKCGTIPNSIGTSYWEYTYDGRGNLISNDKYTRTTSGMAWQNEESFVYDETGRMVQGKNEQGELSLYTYNGLGIRVGRELVMKDNTHGYTDFHSQTPSVDTDIDKPEVVKESYVIDYTSATFNTLVMDEEGGFDYRWVYGLQRLSVKITSEGTNWWGQNVTTDILKDYLHQDRLGSTTNLTDQFGRVVGRADYNEWGEVTFKESLSISSSYRRIYPQLNYTGYDWDDVLGMYYAKARFYSADDKRFVAIDPVKGQITDPLSLVSYLYCVDNPLRWVDPLGLKFTDRDPSMVAISGNTSSDSNNDSNGVDAITGAAPAFNDYSPDEYAVPDLSSATAMSTNSGFPVLPYLIYHYNIRELLLFEGYTNIKVDDNKIEYTTSDGRQHIINNSSEFFWKENGEYWATDGAIFQLIEVPRPTTWGVAADIAFSYDRYKGIWYSETDAPQRIGGYNDFYDAVFCAVDYCKFISVFDFPVKDENGNSKVMEWRIEGWNGNYLNMGIGGEIGLYYQDRIANNKMKEVLDGIPDNTEGITEIRQHFEAYSCHYKVVDEKDWMKMSFNLYHGSPVAQNLIFTTSDSIHWWVTGFRPYAGYIPAHELTMVATIDFPSKDMAAAFKKNIKTYSSSRGAPANKVTFSPGAEKTVTFIWGG